jgi:valyl-tRNA synthetase
MSAETYRATVGFFDQLLRVLHPFMPFISEELWMHLVDRNENDTIMLSDWPTPTVYDQGVIETFALLSEITATVRAIRAEMQVNANAAVSVILKSDDHELVQKLVDIEPVFRKTLRIDQFTAGTQVEAPQKAASGLAGKVAIYVPLEGLIDVDKELDRIDKEIQRLNGFLQSVNVKLSNEKFVANAPEQVLQMERQKLADTHTKLERLQETRAQLLG